LRHTDRQVVAAAGYARRSLHVAQYAIRHHEIAHSEYLELLEITSSAEFATAEVSAPRRTQRQDAGARFNPDFPDGLAFGPLRAPISARRASC
jgi:hypothetical protein